MQIRSLIPRAVKQGIRSQFALANKVVIGTHHKTGTVWMRSIFNEISTDFGLVMISQREDDPPPAQRYNILLHTHSQFDNKLPGQFRGLHIVRDPRDVIVSAAHYHRHSDEPWLHVKRPDLGGLTYQEKINSFPTFDEQMLFEMEHASSRNILSMKNWEYSDQRFLNAKYEDLIQDYKLDYFEKVFKYLGFRKHAIGWCLIFAYRNSLFSRNIQSKHVRSGKPRQWPEYFRPIHKKRFEELFGNVLEIMGYELDEEWKSL